MNFNDNNSEKKGNGAIIDITSIVLGLVAFTLRKALTDKETREKMIDTFFEIKKKLSDSRRNTKRESLGETNLKNATSTGKPTTLGPV